MYLFVVTAHVLLCLFLVGVILLQPGKGGDIGAAFGGGGAGLFGPRGPASLLAQVTPFMAGAFMVTSITLAWYSSRENLANADVYEEIERLEREREAPPSAPQEAPEIQVPDGEPAALPLEAATTPANPAGDETLPVEGAELGDAETP